MKITKTQTTAEVTPEEMGIIRNFCEMLVELNVQSDYDLSLDELVDDISSGRTRLDNANLIFKIV